MVTMAITYLEAISLNWPTYNAHAAGPLYTDIVWDYVPAGFSAPTKAEVDAWILANPTPQIANESSVVRVSADTGVLETWDGTQWVSASTQAGKFYTGKTGSMSGTSVIPADTTTPLITEGSQVWSQTFHPSTDTSKILISQSLMLDVGSSSRVVTLALFRDSTCIYANGSYLSTSGRYVVTPIHAVDVPGQTCNVTYSLRVGSGTTGTTWYINRNAAGTTTYGNAVNAASWSIMEIL